MAAIAMPVVMINAQVPVRSRNRVDDEHGHQRPEFAEDIDSLLGVERVYA